MSRRRGRRGGGAGCRKAGKKSNFSANPPPLKYAKMKNPGKVVHGAQAVIGAMDLALGKNVILRYSVITAGRTRVAHAMFDDILGRRLLNWWPTTGRWYCDGDGTKGKSKDAAEVLAIAISKIAV